MECGLPREAEVDSSYIDETAVARACSGERLLLTVAELAEAARRLDASGMGVRGIARRLHVSASRITDLLAEPSAEVIHLQPATRITAQAA